MQHPFCCYNGETMIRRLRWDGVWPKGLQRSILGMLKAKVRERKGFEDWMRVRERGLGLGGAKGDVFNVVYYIHSMLYTVGHKATILYQVQRSVRASGCMRSSSWVESGLRVLQRASELLRCHFRCWVQRSRNRHVTTVMLTLVTAKSAMIWKLSKGH